MVTVNSGGAGRCRGRTIAVPGSFNDQFADAAIRNHVGDVWYQTEVRVPRGWNGQRIVLRFDAVTHGATVWVDETQVMVHQGDIPLLRRTSAPCWPGVSRCVSPSASITSSPGTPSRRGRSPGQR